MTGRRAMSEQYVRTVDKNGKASYVTKYTGIVYTDKDCKPDETARFTRWEEWVEWHDQRERETTRQMQENLPHAIATFVKDQKGTKKCLCGKAGQECLPLWVKQTSRGPLVVRTIWDKADRAIDEQTKRTAPRK